MKIIKKIGKWLLVLISGFIGIILTLLLIIRINSTGVEEPFLDVHGKVLPNSIAMNEDKLINGAPQRLTIRGKDITNPVLLIVHGGPVAPWPPVLYRLVYQSHMLELEGESMRKKRGQQSMFDDLLSKEIIN